MYLRVYADVSAAVGPPDIEFVFSFFFFFFSIDPHLLAADVYYRNAADIGFVLHNIYTCMCVCM